MCPRRTQDPPDTSLQLYVGSSFSAQDALWGGRCCPILQTRTVQLGGGGRCESCVSGKRRLVGGWRPAWDGVASPLTLMAAAGMRVWTGSSLPARGATGSSWGRDARFCLSTS